MGKPVFLTLVAADDGLPIDEVEVTDAVDISHLEDWNMLLGGTFVGTVSVEVSFDGGTTWVAHPDMAAKTVPVVVPGAMRVQQVRANCTAYTSGNPLIMISGTDEDREG